MSVCITAKIVPPMSQLGQSATCDPAGRMSASAGSGHAAALALALCADFVAKVPNCPAPIFLL
jgi:hypothetical protein